MWLYASEFLVHGYGSKLIQTTWGEATFLGSEQLCITAVTNRRLPTCSNELKSPFLSSGVLDKQALNKHETWKSMHKHQN